MADSHPDPDPRRTLERLLADVEPSPDLAERVDRGLARQARRPRARLLVAAALVLVVGGVAVAGLIDRDGDRPRNVITDAPTTVPAPVTEPPPTVSSTGPAPTTAAPRPEGDGPLPAAPTTPDQADASAWQTVAPAPIEGREAAAWGAGDRYLVVWGGSVDRSGEVSQDGAILDSTTGAWRRLGPFSEVPGRTGATLVVAGRVAYLVGGGTGVGGTEPTGEVAMFDLEAATATVVATSDLAARVSPVVALHEERLVVAGGLVDPPGGSADLRTAALDLASGGWTQGADLPWGVTDDAFLAGRLRGSAAAVADGAVLVAQGRAGDPGGSVQLARLDLATLDLEPLAPVSLGSTDIAIDEARLAVLGDVAVVVVEHGPVEAVGVDLGRDEVRWRSDVELTACEPDVEVQSVAGSALVVRSDCSETLALLDGAGAMATSPALPKAPDGYGRLVAVGDALVLVELGNPGDDPNKGPARPSRTLALAAGG